MTFKSYRVERFTATGVWLAQDYGASRFVCRRWKKRWAAPTKAEALESLIARKRRQAAILRAQLKAADAALDYLKIKGSLVLENDTTTSTLFGFDFQPWGDAE